MKVIKDEAPDRRRSNDGFRKLELPERVLLFLTRMRRKVTFQELGYQYGCGEESASRYCNELAKIFCQHFVPRLVFPRAPTELHSMTRQEVKATFPDLLAILDATNWEQLKPENFLENRLSYSAYKHKNVYQVLLGESGACFVLCWVALAHVVKRSQLFQLKG
jgi:Helix-turn-helix of DDE superfamily endonuclease